MHDGGNRLAEAGSKDRTMASSASPLVGALIALAAGLVTGATIGVAVQARASSEWKQRWQVDTAVLSARAQVAERDLAAAQRTARSAVAESVRLKAVVIDQAREIETLRIAAEPRFADIELEQAPPLPIGIR